MLTTEELVVPNRLRGECFQAKSCVSTDVAVRQDHWRDNGDFMRRSMRRVTMGNYVYAGVRGRNPEPEGLPSLWSLACVQEFHSG